MAYTAPSTQVTGYVVTAANWNELVNNWLASGIDQVTTDGDMIVATGSQAVERVAVMTAANLLKHEVGGIELDISAITTGGMLIGASAGLFEILGYGADTGFVIGVSGKPGWGSQATQANLEGEDDLNNYVPSNLLKYGPGALKFWLDWEQTGAHGITVSYNHTSVTDAGFAGGTDHVINIDFSGITWVLQTGGTNGAGNVRLTGTLSAGSFTSLSENADGSDADFTQNFIGGVGTQV